MRAYFYALFAVVSHITWPKCERHFTELKVKQQKCPAVWVFECFVHVETNSAKKHHSPKKSKKACQHCLDKACPLCPHSSLSPIRVSQQTSCTGMFEVSQGCTSCLTIIWTHQPTSLNLQFNHVTQPCHGIYIAKVLQMLLRLLLVLRFLKRFQPFILCNAGCWTLVNPVWTTCQTTIGTFYTPDWTYKDSVLTNGSSILFLQ